MNPIFKLQAEIVNAVDFCIRNSKNDSFVKQEIKRLQNQSNSMKLVRDRYATSTLITTMLCNVISLKTCLAYEYNGELYCTAKNVPNLKSTELLIGRGFTSSQWDAMPRYHVWIHSGIVYGKVPEMTA